MIAARDIGDPMSIPRALGLFVWGEASSRPRIVRFAKRVASRVDA